MPRGPSEAIVTKFLRNALAVDAVGVPELDEKARAKGLLAAPSDAARNKVVWGVSTEPRGSGGWFDLHELDPLDRPQRDDSVPEMLRRDWPGGDRERQSHARDLMVKPGQPSLDRLRRPYVRVPVHCATMRLDS